jgi:hypothetical protein
MNSVRVPEVNIRVNTGNLQARRMTHNSAVKNALFIKFLKAQKVPNASNLPENKIHTAREIISILRSLLYLKNNLTNTNLNKLFASLRRRINIIEGQLKKRVPNRPRSTSGTPKTNTNNRQ